MSKAGKIEGDYELVTEKVTLDTCGLRETTLGFVPFFCQFLYGLYINPSFRKQQGKIPRCDFISECEVDCWVKTQNLSGFFLRFSIGPTSASRNSIQRKFYFTIIHQLVPVPSAGEVDGGKIADRVASCRHDPQGQHGHLLAQVRISILIFHKKFP